MGRLGKPGTPPAVTDVAGHGSAPFLLVELRLEAFGELRSH
jgi:hypothetical protein